MNSEIRPLAFLFLLSVCLSCTKLVSCPGYQVSVLDEWFPYNNGQQFRFETTGGLRRTYTLTAPYVTAPYEFRTGFGASTTNCPAEKVINNSERDTTGAPSFSLQLTMAAKGTEQQRAARLALERTEVVVEKVTASGFATAAIDGRPATLSSIGQRTLGNRSFTDLRLAARDTVANKAPGIFEFYFCKDKGVVAYAEYPSGTLWVLQ